MFAPTAAWIDAVRPGRRVGHAIEAHDVIASTNDRARELLTAGGADGVVVVADAQTAGRGRRGRTWVSEPGRGLLCSAAVELDIGAGDAWKLALGAALAVAAACDAVTPVMLKWPNDVVDDEGRKLAGILIESILDGDRVACAVIGVGVNVSGRRADLPAELRDMATSLSELSGGPVDRVELLDRLLDAVSTEVAAIESGRSPVERYRARCATLGREVAVAIGADTLTGIAVDIDEAGALVIDASDGRVAVTSGEVRWVRAVHS